MSVWTMPTLIGAMTVAGLLAALFADGLADGLSVLLLGVPAALCAWLAWLRR